MKGEILALYGSPRRGGFTSQMQDAFVDTVLSAGQRVNKIYIDELTVAGCRACGACRDTFSCVIEDDMRNLYPLIKDAALISVAAPVYFSGVPGPLKTVIDRCQVIWELDTRAPAEIASKEALLFSAAGSDFPGAFEGLFLTMRHFFNTDAAVLKKENFFFLSDTDRLDRVPESLNEKIQRRSGELLQGLVQK